LRFAERRKEFSGLDLTERFELIYRTNLWGADASVSGLGSELSATVRLRQEFSGLLHNMGVKTLLDLPCGDFTWMAETDLRGVHYIGADIVQEIVDANARNYGGVNREFERLDLVEDSLPLSDLVLCRDCLVHLSFGHINRAIENIRQSGSRWLLTTTFPDLYENRDIEDGDWRALNLQAAPFFFPEPAVLIDEGCTEADGEYADKSLALWSISSLPAMRTAR
jgi:hypothetical protein